MDDDATVAIKDQSTFWRELEAKVNTTCNTHEDIDDALRGFVGLITEYKESDLGYAHEFARCSYALLDSRLFAEHREYVRRQLVYALLQDDDTDTLHLAASACLHDARNDESISEMMLDEGAFLRLIELIQQKPDDNNDLHRLLIELLFEVSRIEKLDADDLVLVGDEFILYLFRLIEDLSDDADDPYHYPVIRVLLIFNEQYMAFASKPPPDNGPILTNRILKLLSSHGLLYRTFGENLILLLNRESALSAQLLILKLLYLLFTTPSTQEYFYTNDLHVLVDVIIRNLLNLDMGNMRDSEEDLSQDGERVLRHTYLRVLCPLLKNTQLARDDLHYKKDELRKLLHLLINHSSAHFAPVDETVIRLVIRCKKIDWLREAGDESADDGIIEPKLAEVRPDAADVANRLLGMTVDAARESSLSIADIPTTIPKQKPSLPAPRRRGRKTLVDSAEPPSGRNLTIPMIRTSQPSPEKQRSPFADDYDDT